LRDRPHLRAAYVYATLIGGRPGTAMPSWAGRLEETELWQVVAYVVSLHPERK
jgi:mono/diheme cytochrome c family protein